MMTQKIVSQGRHVPVYREQLTPLLVSSAAAESVWPISVEWERGGECEMTLYDGVGPDAQMLKVITNPQDGERIEVSIYPQRGLAYTLKGAVSVTNQYKAEITFTNHEGYPGTVVDE
jgi:hypothetical protein